MFAANTLSPLAWVGTFEHLVSDRRLAFLRKIHLAFVFGGAKRQLLIERSKTSWAIGVAQSIIYEVEYIFCPSKVCFGP